MSWVTLGLELVLAIGVYELFRALLFRRVRSTVRRSAVRFVRQHRIRLESARFIDRVWIREALAQDARIETEVARIARETDRSVVELRDLVDAYVEEIAPFFSLTAYYRIGPLLAKRIIDFCFELVFEAGAFDKQVASVPPNAVRVYVINHRANIDPLVLSYGLLHNVPMSYAVGEWALVWPLHTLFRAFGSYFVRRGEKDPLYHAVLERFVQLSAGEGAVTGFFIEGGLSRDGGLRKPRIGLIDYIVGLRNEQPDREIAFMPVGLNYDRVFEDRILTREKDGPLPKPTRSERLMNFASILFWVPQLVVANLFRVATRSHRKFGYAAIGFGEPLLLSRWPGGADLHLQPEEERQRLLVDLADELVFERIARVVPATPVAVLCEAMRREGPDDHGAIRARVAVVLADLRANDAPLALGHAFADTGMSAQEEADRVAGLAGQLMVRRRVLRRVLTPTGDGMELVPGTEDIVAYYANSIRHHLT